MFKAVMFDFDGTIADTLPAILTALNATMRRFGYAERTLGDVQAFIGNGSRKLVMRSMPEAARTPATVNRVLADYNASYEAHHLETVETYPGVDALIRSLHEAGIKVGVLSNKQDPMLRGLCAQLLPGAVDLVIGQREGYPTKPDPTVPLEMAAALGVAPGEIAFVGDSDVDMVTAVNAGFVPVGVAWGYRPAELLHEKGAAYVAVSAAELAAYLTA